MFKKIYEKFHFQVIECNKTQYFSIIFFPKSIIMCAVEGYPFKNQTFQVRATLLVLYA